MDGQFFKGLAVGCLGTIVITLGAVTITQSGNPLSVSETGKLNYILKQVNKYYAGEMQYGKTIEDGLYEGVFLNLDEYSCYYTPAEYEELTSATDYVGIGVKSTISKYSGAYTILQVYEGSPAYEAGLQKLDVVNKVDGESISGMKLDEISDLMRGDKGTTVELEVLRGYNTFTVTLERRPVVVSYVHSQMLSDTTGYIKIDSFDSTVAKDFKEHLSLLDDSGMENMILDLRDNLGGTVDLAVEIMASFLPDGLVCSLETSDGGHTDYKITNGVDPKYNLVVLVNENTASASEILTSYVQELNLGVVMGQTTYGKGIYQGLLPLSDGSAIKMTFGRYYTHNGNNIQGVGLEPDIWDDFVYDSYLDDISIETDECVQHAMELFQ